jgi:stearoyl-CoA desaturase (delta-9 desaturase)
MATPSGILHFFYNRFLRFHLPLKGEDNPLKVEIKNMSKKIPWKQIDWVNTIFLTLTPILAIVALGFHLYFDGLMLSQWLLFVGFYFLTGLSITVGYHRLFAHKSYKAKPILETILLFFGAATFQNSALKWASDHRRHHTKVDTDEDPYNIGEGLFYAHMGWVMVKGQDERYEKDFAKDLIKNPRVKFQHDHYMVIAVISGMILPTFLGYLLGSWLGGLALATLTRIVFVHHVTFFINSFCHYFGNQPYDDSHTARDSAIMALFTYGEGYHNYHHTFQWDYRNGIKWYHYDPSKWIIKTLSFFKITEGLKKVTPEMILLSRIAMDEKRMKTRPEWPVADELSAKMKAILEQINIIKNGLKKSGEDNKALLKIRLKELEFELKNTLKQWESILRGDLLPSSI